MKQRTILIAILGIIMIFTLPTLMNTFIFSNNIFSKVSNDGWASFLGGYIGAIITLAGVVITIWNLNKENLKTNDQNKQQLLEERRLSILPYLTYEFQYSELPEGYSVIPIGVDLSDDNFDYITKAQIMKINNYGLGAACDISFKIYVNGEDSDYYEDIVTLLPNSNKSYDKMLVFALPNNKYTLKKHMNYNLWIVIFYKDLLSNQYVQEISGSINIEPIQDTLGEFVYSFDLYSVREPRTIFDEISYSLPTWFNREKNLDDFIKNELLDVYNENKENELDQFLSEKGLCVLERFENQLVSYAKETFNLPHLKAGRGDLIGFKKLSDKKWQTVYFSERGLNLENVIIYFVVIDLDLNNCVAKISDIKIHDNTLSEDEKLIDKFNKKIMKMGIGKLV